MNYGVVAEFNPFHNGHKYLVDALKADKASAVTAVMSESFVQRGECAAFSVNTRAKCALSSGVDLVLSLPLPFAVASAERFAFGGISVLSSLSDIDCIAFGSECGDTEILKMCADALLKEEVVIKISELLKDGVSYPRAREGALFELFGGEVSNVLKNPNDTLAVEYIKALKRLGSKLPFKAVKRMGASHDSIDVFEGFRSASDIRNNLLLNCEYTDFVPEAVVVILSSEIKNGKAPANYQKLETAVLSSLRTMSKAELANLPDVSEGLENRIYDAVRISSSLEEVYSNIKTKRYTHSRIRRIVLAAFLGLTKEDAKGMPPYIRVLGFNENGARILNQSKKSMLPIVTKLSEIKKLGGEAQRMFDLECKARDLFSLALPVPDECGKEMTDKIIIVNEG